LAGGLGRTMKCPRCQFISFDNLTRCKKCGLPFGQETECVDDAAAKRTPQAQSSSMAGPYENILKTFETIKKDLADLEVMQTESNKTCALVKDNIDKGRPLKSVLHEQAKGPLRYAGFLIRLLAYSIDMMIVFLIALLFTFVSMSIIGMQAASGSDLVSMINSIYLPYMVIEMLVEAVYFTYFHAITGQTVGKRICGIRVLSSNGNTLGLRRALIRFCGYVLGRFMLYCGFVWIVFDRRKQGWHDKMAGSYVMLE